jgi:gamma-glutamyltranspeptidase / glutathione hydrolase
MVFQSGRSPVFTLSGVAASSQPAASAAGVEIMHSGGSAADAAIAMAAVLAVTEPCSTGLGGDVFVLYYQASDRKVYALNGSGRAPAALSLDRVIQNGFKNGLPSSHPDTITVPGACAAWFDLLERFGRLNPRDVLTPAIRLAENGFPVEPLTSYYWRRAAGRQLVSSGNGSELMISGRGPLPGEVFHNPGMVRTFRLLAESGKEAFYQGPIAEAIVEVIRQAGGCMALADLAAHTSTWEEPLSAEYKDIRLWECPPNGQGIVALQALELLQFTDIDQTKSLSPDRLHLQIEALRLAFCDARAYLTDPVFPHLPSELFLSPEYSRQRAGLIQPGQAAISPRAGSPIYSSDTVYFCAVDPQGNACSMVNSNYMSFGTGIVPKGFGFSLQNRGLNFSLDPSHPNALQPGKRPYHTIIPAMATRDSDRSLYAALGVMGGFMQPQGHLQVFQSLVLDRMDPQAALDLPRFCIDVDENNGQVLIEEGIPDDVIRELKARGHSIRMVDGYARSVFGRGQIITIGKDGRRCAGSDPRADGCAISM